MNSLVLLLICVAILIVGYICYGGWLCKQWGVGDSKTETPAHTMEDGVADITYNQDCNADEKKYQ